MSNPLPGPPPAYSATTARNLNQFFDDADNNTKLAVPAGIDPTLNSPLSPPYSTPPLSPFPSTDQPSISRPPPPHDPHAFISDRSTPTPQNQPKQLESLPALGDNTNDTIQVDSGGTVFGSNRPETSPSRKSSTSSTGTSGFSSTTSMRSRQIRQPAPLSFREYSLGRAEGDIDSPEANNNNGMVNDMDPQNGKPAGIMVTDTSGFAGGSPASPAGTSSSSGPTPLTARLPHSAQISVSSRRATVQFSGEAPPPGFHHPKRSNLGSNLAPGSLAASSQHSHYRDPTSPMVPHASSIHRNHNRTPSWNAVTSNSTGIPHGLSSPCFIHNYLDHTLSEVLKRQHHHLHTSVAMGSGGDRYGKKRIRSKSDMGPRTKEKIAHSIAADTEDAEQEDNNNTDGEDTKAHDPPTPRTSRPTLSSGDITGRHSLAQLDKQLLAQVQSGLGEDDDTAEEEEGEFEENEFSQDEDEGQSLTRQLAETAMSVREMSKQLGRARVKSQVQSIMIITKARDNHLIKLTKELAMHLMTKPRHGKKRGLIVYVDAQLRKSKRFDAAGIERDHPELFRPVTRRFSRTSSSSSLHSEYYQSNNSSHIRQESTPSSNGDFASNLKNASPGANNEVLVEHVRRGNNPSLNGATSPKQKASAKSKRRNSSGMSAAASETSFGSEEGQLRYWTADMCTKAPHLFDLVVTLGGDGTVLFASWLFQNIVPPIIPFALGSLGFLTNFDFADHEKVMDNAIDNGIRVNLRMRFTCTVYRAVAKVEDSKKRRAIRSGRTGEILMNDLKKGGWANLEAGMAGVPNTNNAGGLGKDKEIMCFTTKPVEQFQVINDLVVDRGPSPYVSLLELFGDEHHMTTVQADGLTVSTPTGSTAYSLSAGGSLVHPEIPAILITPICPHTLSFRPMLLPDSMEVRICVPYNSRSTAWASFDGRGRVELKQGDHIKIQPSQYPFPTVCAEKQSTDWFHAIARTLKWNERERQKSFVVVEQGKEKRKKPSQVRSHHTEAETGNDVRGDADVEDEEEEEEEEDQTFDIDDISSETQTVDTGPTSTTSSTPAMPKSPASTQNHSPQEPTGALGHGLVQPDRQSDDGERFRHPYPRPPKLSNRHRHQPHHYGHHHRATGSHATNPITTSGLAGEGKDESMRTPRRPPSGLVNAPGGHYRSGSKTRRRTQDKPYQQDPGSEAELEELEGERAFAVYGRDYSSASEAE